MKDGGMGALILTRKIGQQIHIGESVTIEVVLIKGKQVRLRVEAPKNVLVQRAEKQTYEENDDVE